jgi:hypothetical protein
MAQEHTWRRLGRRTVGVVDDERDRVGGGLQNLDWHIFGADQYCALLAQL